MSDALKFSLVAVAVSFGLSVLLTFLTRGAARKFGIVAAPNSDRWHKAPTAMLGGCAIFATCVALIPIFVPLSREVLVVFGASALLFVVGLIDDTLNIKPYQKLIGQVFGAIIIIAADLKLPLTGIELIDIAITVVWIVGITNAINLLDNMDGLAGGISTIAAVSLFVAFMTAGKPDEMLIIAVFIGAMLGFLVFNFNPASIFMGDCGSMFVGFFLASSVLLNQDGGRSRSIFTILAVPVLILFVPIFDTTFVTLIRKLWGRKASQGGRDHTSHRLVALGLSERSAVLLLYALAVIAGIISLAVSNMPVSQSIAIIVAFTVFLTIVGVYLSKVHVYEDNEEEKALRENAVFGFIVDVSHKRRIFEVVLDVCLITLAYYASYIFIFGSLDNYENWELFLTSLPILIIVKLASFLIFGVYRGIWRYTGIHDIIAFTKGVVAGSAFSVLALLLFFRFQSFSRAVFILDGILLLVAVIGSRMAFRLFRQLLPQAKTLDGRRVLIYGAGDGGEMILRELKNNPQWGYLPVGFLDDDDLKAGKIINGLRVQKPNGMLVEFCREKDISEILISFRATDTTAYSELKAICRTANIRLMKAHLTIEPVEFE